MLNRRELLVIGGASALLAAAGLPVLAATEGLVGHSVFSLDDVLTGKAPPDVARVYLTDISIARIQRASKSNDYSLQVEKPNPGRLERQARFHRIFKMMDDGFVVLRPASMGPVGRLYWTRNGVPVVEAWMEQDKPSYMWGKETQPFLY